MSRSRTTGAVSGAVVFVKLAAGPSFLKELA